MTEHRLKVFFIGSVHSSECALKVLLGLPHVDVRGILTQRQSRFNADFTDISEIAERAGIAVHYSEDTNQTDLAGLIRAQDIDAVFAVGWSRLLDASVLEAPKLGVVGFHPADLPNNRGRHPLIWALVLGLEKTASTFFFMDEGADSGPILSKVPLNISSDDDAQSLYDKVLDVIPGQLRDITQGLLDGTLHGQAQDHSKATFWRKRGASDGLIDWRMSASATHNLIRGLSRPYVGADFLLEGKLVKVWKSEVVSTPIPRNAEPGKILSVDREGVVIKTGDGAIRLVEYDLNQKLLQGNYL